MFRHSNGCPPCNRTDGTQRYLESGDDTGEKRPAIHPDLVRIYLDPPADYETIGAIAVSSNGMLNRQAAQDKAMKALRLRAAKVGANGVLITHMGSQTAATDGGSVDKILTQGRAIYTPEQQ